MYFKEGKRLREGNEQFFFTPNVQASLLPYKTNMLYQLIVLFEAQVCKICEIKAHNNYVDIVTRLLT